MENTAIDDDLQIEHGLSLYVRTDKHKILFDTGQSDKFINNAQHMQVDLTAVDSVLISHGHYDHGGGLEAFFVLNRYAPVYIQKGAFENHLAKTTSGHNYIGIKKELALLPRMIFVRDYLQIDDELEIFAGVNGRQYHSPANDILLKEEQGTIQPDNFLHEQNLIITTAPGQAILIAGCAHNGIVNIMQHFINLKGFAPKVVVGGFHLMRGGVAPYVPDKLIDDIAAWLAQYPSTLYLTGHCTGLPAFERMKDKLGSQLEYLYTGSVFEFA